MFKHINCQQAAELLKETSTQIVDIRDPASFQAGHIKNSVNIDNQNVADYIREADMDAPLIVVCYHGNSSQGAANYFHQQGFDDVYSLDGGYEAWKVEKS